MPNLVSLFSSSLVLHSQMLHMKKFEQNQLLKSRLVLQEHILS